MKLIQLVLLAFITCTSMNCQSKKKPQPKSNVMPEVAQDYETAYFASGCFWCVESIFESVKGVQEVVSGYSGGTEENPTYEDVSYGKTSHAEAVEVYYNPKVVSFETLVKIFFGSHNPTTLNQQGPDKGAQYRSIAFYKNKAEKKIITNYISTLEKDKIYSAPIVTEVIPFTVFYKAENYHQNYEKNNPNNYYIKNISIPRLKQFQAKFPALLKSQTH